VPETVSAKSRIAQMSLNEFQAAGPATANAQRSYMLTLSQHNQVTMVCWASRLSSMFNGATGGELVAHETDEWDSFGFAKLHNVQCKRMCAVRTRKNPNYVFVC